MLRTRWSGLSAVLFGLLMLSSSASAQVSDQRKLFSERAVQDANAVIGNIARNYKKQLVIETRLAPSEVKDAPKDKVGAAMANWTKTEFKRRNIDGVYVVITSSPDRFYVFVGDNTRTSGFVKEEDRLRIEKTLADLLPKPAKHDEALGSITQIVNSAMAQRPIGNQKGAPKAGAGAAPVGAGNAAEDEGMSLGMMIAIGIGILLAVWIVFAIIRALTAPRMQPGMGGPGGQPGYGGYGGGGGGGGFMTSMLGGLFGAAAGMWMYNSFFGGGSSAFGGSPPMGGAGSSPSDPAPDTSGSGGGGSYGEDPAAPDAGGGDWGGGGGGDAGGGDWGGGGGGGDWGGGGDGGGGGGGDW